MLHECGLKNPAEVLEVRVNSSKHVNAWEVVLAPFAEVTGGSFQQPDGRGSGGSGLPRSMVA